jgi:hypothetical protein
VTANADWTFLSFYHVYAGKVTRKEFHVWYVMLTHHQQKNHDHRKPADFHLKEEL